MSLYSTSSGLKSIILKPTLLTNDEPLDRFDVIIRFLFAEVIL